MEMKWRNVSSVICDKEVPLKLKGKFYSIAIRPTILYGTRSWVVKNQQENKLDDIEIRMLRWMNEHTRHDRIGNECIREKVRITLILEK